MRLHLSIACAALLVGGAASAQHSVVFALDTDEFLLDGADGLLEAGELKNDEVGIVTPVPGVFYSASTFMSIGAQWIWMGDADGDARVLDSSTSAPGGDVDAVFVRRFPAPPTGPIDPSELFVSKEGSTDMDASVNDGDVFRYTPGGGIEVFLTEAHLLEAVGQSPTADLDLNAIAQSDTGDLFVSFDLTETVGGVSAEDGSIIWIPASAITYDGDGNVSAIANSSAVIAASESDVNAMIAASGVMTSVGGMPSTSIDVGALEIDPAGGTWESPQMPGTFLPNLLFGWLGFANDGAILSTAGGGTIATINGVEMGSTTATTGLQLGVAPDSTGINGIAGLAVVPVMEDPLVVETYPTRLITSSTILFTRQEVSGATPGAPVAFIATLDPGGPGTTIPAMTITPFGGLFFGDTSSAIVTGVETATPGGHAGRIHFLPASLVGSGAVVVWQVMDVATFTFGTPSGVQFL